MKKPAEALSFSGFFFGRSMRRFTGVIAGLPAMNDDAVFRLTSA
jgi:hypothetical protein